ncbi:sugar phosphate isomerase/epimerase family protein [Pelagibacterium montanilacus]|uniref:sugar phosphate isomerase/epimerase family protein n=1 Tax=Pelagibacterium montanilacus TaxID=2185280 RepID=UPI0013E09D98|nr:TIM barrel protein [Pelagibacterium montanilacus]
MPITIDQFCGSNFSYFRFPFVTFLADMVDLGIGNIEIWGVSPHLYAPDMTDSDVAAVKSQIDDRGLNVRCFTPEQCIYPINIAAEERVIRERSLAYFMRCVEVAALLDAPYMFLTSGWGYEGEPREQAWERSVQSLKAITSYAAENGVTAVLEGLQPVESNIVNTAGDIKSMIQQVGPSNLKPALDTVGMAVNGETVKDYIACFGAGIEYAHFVDGRPAGHVAWGDGELPLAEYLRDLQSIDYKGYLSVEFAGPNYYMTPRVPVEQSRDAIRAALADLNK